MWTRDVALSPLPHYLHQPPSRSILIYPRQSSRPKQAQPRFVNGSQALGNPNIACKMPGTGKLVAAGPQLNIDFSLLWESDHPQQHSPQTCGSPPSRLILGFCSPESFIFKSNKGQSSRHCRTLYQRPTLLRLGNPNCNLKKHFDFLKFPEIQPLLQDV